MDKIKLLMIGDSPTSPTGFGRVGASIAKNLPQEDYTISWLGVNYHGDPHSFPYRIYPPELGGDVYGFRRLREIVAEEKPDIVWILNDAWVQNDYLSILGQMREEKIGPKIVTYTPVDAEFHEPQWYQFFHIVDVPVAYNRFGYEEMVRARPDLEQRLLVIPHGIDTDTFYPLAPTRREFKLSYFPREEYADYFIALSAHRNQPRKKLDLTMYGFAMFAQGKEDVKLFMHCGVTDSSIDVAKLAIRTGIDHKILMSGVVHGIQRVTDAHLNKIYNACDVGLNTGLGEGWGLPNMEHAVTGAAQIIPYHSALKDLWKDAGIFIPAEIPVTLDNLMTIGKMVTAEDVAATLQYCYDHREETDAMGKKGQEKFSNPNYSWANITKTWDRIFKDLMP